MTPTFREEKCLHLKESLLQARGKNPSFSKGYYSAPASIIVIRRVLEMAFLAARKLPALHENEDRGASFLPPSKVVGVQFSVGWQWSYIPIMVLPRFGEGGMGILEASYPQIILMSNDSS